MGTNKLSTSSERWQRSIDYIIVTTTTSTTITIGGLEDSSEIKYYLIIICAVEYPVFNISKALYFSGVR